MKKIKRAVKTPRKFNVRMPNYSEEQKIDIALRCVFGENSADLANEFNVPANVIDSWVERIGDVISGTPDGGASVELKKKIDALMAQREHLTKRLESRRNRLEILELAKNMSQNRPAFMVGGGLE